MDLKKCSICNKVVGELHQKNPPLCQSCWHKQHYANNIKECSECHELKPIQAKGKCSACYKQSRIDAGYIRQPKLKECINCHEFKDIVARNLCEECYRNQYHKEWYEENRETRIKQIKARLDNNIGFCETCKNIKSLKGKNICESCYGKQYHVANRYRLLDKSQDWYYNKGGQAHKVYKAYSLSEEGYNKLNDDQQGLCAICGSPEIEGFRLAVDHNHETGDVRGLLCRRCNS